MQAQAEKTTFPAAGGTGTLRVATNRECAWTATSAAGWLSLSSPPRGEGEGSVAFTVAANQDPSSRSGRITVNEQEVQISQDPKPCEFRLSSTEERFDPAGGDGRIDVHPTSEQCEWSARSGEPWIDVVSGEQGKGSGAVAFRVDPLTGASRTGSLTIAGTPVRIEQSRQQPPPSPSPSPPGCSFLIGPVAFSFGASGGAGEVRVTTAAGCSWIAESPVEWITFSGPTSGTGPGGVTFRVTATDGPERTTLLKVAHNVVTVAQSPGCAFAVTPASHHAPAAGGTGTVTVGTASGCSWTATTGTSWLNITSGSNGSGQGRVEFTIQANTGPERSGSLTVAGRTVTVTQPSGCRYDVSPSSVDAAATGDSRTITVATGAGCSWSAASNVPWATVSSAHGTGTGQVQLSVAANSSPARSGAVSIAGQPIAVQQASLCTFMMNSDASSFDVNGGQGLVLVFVTGPCTWTASSGVDWIRVEAETASATGSGFVRFSVAPNGGGARGGTVTIAGMSHRVAQTGR